MNVTTSSDRRNRLLSASLGVGASGIANQALAFARNVVIARLVSPSDFGIAAVFAMTLNVLDLSSNMSPEKKLIQATGSVQRIQRTLQGVEVLRSALIALVPFAFSGWLSAVFGLVGTEWAFQLLGVLVLFRGFLHLDMYRYQRDLRFRPSIKVEVWSGVIATIVAIPAGYILRDYTAMLLVLIARTAGQVVMSHVVAETPYSLKGDRHSLKEIWTYGWPLILNGLLLFAVMQGDRAIIGVSHSVFGASPYTMEDLGIYAVTATIALIPGSLAAGVCNSVLVPYLAEAQQSRVDFESRYQRALAFVALPSAVVSCGFIVLGDWAIQIVYGPGYKSGGNLVGWLGLAQALRILRIVPTAALLSAAETRAVLNNNLVRALGLGGAFYAAAIAAPLYWIAVSAAGAEALALVTSSIQLRSVREIGLVRSSLTTAILLSCSGVALFVDGRLSESDVIWRIAAFLTVASVQVAALAIWGDGIVREFGEGLWSRVRLGREPGRI